jgi:hypothetical protein
MGLGGARIAFAGALVAVALTAWGCGAESRPSEPRPQVSTRVSVSISPAGVEVRPGKVAFGPEKSQQIPQNQNHPQPPIESDAPLDVTIVAANQTRRDVKLQVRGPASASETIYAGSPGTLHTDLPTGTYVVTAAGVPTARPGKLIVGPYRASSENDVLLP